MRLGITGHQRLGPIDTVDWVSKQLCRAIEALRPQIGVTSLATGADQLFAETLLNKHIPYEVIIPSRKYETTFGAADLPAYKRLLEHATACEILPFNEPTEDAFYAAGREIVERADYLIAVWNGLPAKGKGGTADIVQHARAHHKPVFQINPADHTTSGDLI
jgi:hypothetical protein